MTPAACTAMPCASPIVRAVSDRVTVGTDTAGKVLGQFTRMGKTHPAISDVAWVGAGKGHSAAAQGNRNRRDLTGLPAQTEIDPQR